MLKIALRTIGLIFCLHFSGWGTPTPELHASELPLRSRENSFVINSTPLPSAPPCVVTGCYAEMKGGSCHWPNRGCSDLAHEIPEGSWIFPLIKGACEKDGGIYSSDRCPLTGLSGSCDFGPKTNGLESVHRSYQSEGVTTDDARAACKTEDQHSCAVFCLPQE